MIGYVTLWFGVAIFTYLLVRGATRTPKEKDLTC